MTERKNVYYIYLEKETQKINQEPLKQKIPDQAFNI